MQWHTWARHTCGGLNQGHRSWQEGSGLQAQLLTRWLAGAGVAAVAALAATWWFRGEPVAEPPSAQAQGVFDSLSWFLGAWPVNAVASLQPFVVTAGLTILAAALLGLAAWRVHRNRSPEIVDVASTGPRA